MRPGSASGSGRRESAADSHKQPGDAQKSAPTAAAPRVQLASVVMFTRELDVSVDFYRQLLGMEVTARSTTAALLVSADGLQVYLRSVGANATHAVGSVGVQYVIWTAADEEDLWRCERFLKDAKAHVHTRTGDGFTLVEGSDPSGVPVMVAYPGPDLAVRTRIMSRIYVW